MQIFELVGRMIIEGQAKAEEGLTRLEGFAKKNEKAFKTMGKAMTVAGGVIVGGLALAVKSATDFGSAMREVNTMMGLSNEDFKSFSKEIQKLSSDLGVDAVESAKALYQAISAGVPKDNAIEFLTIATKAAIGGVTSTEVAVDGLSTVINAFKLPLSDTQRVADLMFTTVKGGKTTFEELSGSIGMVAPAAAAMGVKFSDLSAAFATLTKQGIDTARASTSLNAIMTALITPTTEMAAAIEGLGYESVDALIAEVGLAEALTLLTDKAGGSKEMLGKMFSSSEALKGIFALTGDSAKLFAADLEAAANAADASLEAFLEMEKGTGRMMAHLKASIQGVSITIGNALLPALGAIVAKITPVVAGIASWLSENPKLTQVVTLFAAAVGGLLLVLGPLVFALPNLVKGFALVRQGLVLLRASFLATKIGAIAMWAGITLGLSVAIAAGIELYQNWDKVSAWLGKTWTSIEMWFLEGVESILDTLVKFTSFIPGLGGKIGELRDAFSNIVDKEGVKKAILSVEELLLKNAEAIDEQKTKAKELTEAIKTELTNRWDAQKKGFEDERVAAQKVHDDRLEAIEDEYGETKEAVKSLVQLERDRYDNEIQNIKNKRDAARDAHQEALANAETEYKASLSREQRYLQDQIDDLDQQTRNEEEALSRQADQKRLVELQEALAASETDEEYATAKARLDEFVANLARKALLRDRQDAKDALRDRIQAIRDEQGEVVAIAKEARDKAIEVANEALRVELANLVTKETESGVAHTNELARIKKAKEEAITAAGATLVASLKTINETEAGLLLSHNNQMTRLQTELDTFIGNNAAKLTDTEEFVENLNLALEEIKDVEYTVTRIEKTVQESSSGEEKRRVTIGPYEGLVTGGIVMRETIARIGENAPRIPEAVIPLSRESLAGLGLGGFKTANIIVMLDGKVLGRVVGQPLVEEILLKTGFRR